MTTAFNDSPQTSTPTTPTANSAQPQASSTTRLWQNGYHFDTLVDGGVILTSCTPYPSKGRLEESPFRKAFTTIEEALQWLLTTYHRDRPEVKLDQLKSAYRPTQADINDFGADAGLDD